MKVIIIIVYLVKIQGAKNVKFIIKVFVMNVINPNNYWKTIVAKNRNIF
jgi:hypothetical protein